MIISIDTQKRLDSIKKINKEKAEAALAELIETVKTNQAKELLGLPVEKVDIKDLQSNAAILQENITYPTTDKNYKPIKIK